MDHVVLGKRLRAFREEIGMSQQDVAERLKLPRSAISLIETGQRPISTIELTEMATVFRRTAAELLAPSGEEGEGYLAVLHLRAPELRNDPRVQADVETCLEMCRIGVDLEKTLGREKRPGPPDYAPPLPGNAAEAVAQGVKVADEERQRLGLGSAPIRNIAARINEQGVWATKTRLSTDMSGLFMHHAAIGLVIITNAGEGHDQERRRFAFAHEYGHALMDRSRRVQVTTTANSEDFIEQRANAFAAAFLLPSSGVDHFMTALAKGGVSRQQQYFYNVASNGKFDVERRELPNSQTITLQDVAMLATSFGVGYEAATYRLNELGYLDLAQAQELRKKVDHGRRYIELLGKIPTDDNGGTLSSSAGDPELRSQILHLAMEAFRRDEISQGRLADIGRKLGINGRLLLDLANEEREALSD